MKAIHMEQKYQEADNIVTFNHVLDFKMGPREMRAKGVFSTVFESTMLDWDLSLRKELFSRREPSSRDSVWAITLEGNGFRDHYPPIRRVDFKLNVIDFDGSVQETLKYFIDGQMMTQQNLNNQRRRGAINKMYSTQNNNSLFFDRKLAMLMDEMKKKELSLQLETRLEFRKTDLMDEKFLVGDGAPGVPEKLDYFFDAITNRSRHDIKLKTSDGGRFLMTNKEILCLASSYFRQNLKEQTIEYTVARADTLESIDICLTYLVTGRYKKPREMTPRLAFEIISLARQWKVFEVKILQNSLERHCYEELIKNREDFLYVCNLLIIADDSQFSNIVNCCLATIISYHFHQFMKTFVNGNHPLKERLTQRREFQRPSLAMQVKRSFAASIETKSFIKFLPALGED
ncbi:hypothetical protein GCK72_002931 [Caenorhabditis remanei]|uniref:BTB domain-containing protein n=1 Tax=Caenorhabditis remanei TaxID=31234 RepID=A0A6A5HW76_CAERE|nr:hypothetical protein GCK72_002931 [Caenorhabditis remanei]KAF1771106.1 hypothetical protein GCK72_002931 [Caenorhabditis remanei]